VATVTVIRHVLMWMLWIDHVIFLMKLIFTATSQFIRWNRKSGTCYGCIKKLSP